MLPLHEVISLFQGKIFTTLNNLVTDFKNFKVRTSAALALASPSERKYYGIYYQNTWTALLKSLENTQYIDDYTEYQHKNRLIEQVPYLNEFEIFLSIFFYL